MHVSFSDLIRKGVEAAKSGNRNEAHELFLQAVRLNPQEARAWLYLAYVSPTKDEKRKALEMVLRLDPSNEKAQDLLRNLIKSGTTIKPIQIHSDTERQIERVSRPLKQRITWAMLVLIPVIIIAVIAGVIFVRKADNQKKQKDLLTRSCLFENEYMSDSECEEYADENIKFISEDVNRCYRKYSDSIELFSRCMEEPRDRLVNQSRSLNTYCVYVLYPSCREQMCDDAPIEITTPCGLWAEDILLNYSRDANTCWEAHNPFEHLLHEGGKMSDAFDPFGTCIETNANTLPPHETTDSLQLIPTPTQYIEPTIDLVSIVVASRDIPRGEIVIEDMLMLELWPKQALPEETEYFTNLNDVIGQTARTDILIRSPILRRQVVEKAE